MNIFVLKTLKGFFKRVLHGRQREVLVSIVTARRPVRTPTPHPQRRRRGGWSRESLTDSKSSKCRSDCETVCTCVCACACVNFKNRLFQIPIEGDWWEGKSCGLFPASKEPPMAPPPPLPPPPKGCCPKNKALGLPVEKLNFNSSGGLYNGHGSRRLVSNAHTVQK